MELFDNEKVIQPEEYETIINHKNNGIDDSIYYRYVASPICNYLIEYFPRWIA